MPSKPLLMSKIIRLSLLSIFMIISMIGLVNAAGTGLYFNLPYNYQVYRTDSSYTDITQSSPLGSGSSTYVTSLPSGVTQHYKAYIDYSIAGNTGSGIAFFSPDNENYVLLKTWLNFAGIDNTINANFSKYRHSGYYLGVYKHYELPFGATCHATYVSEHFNSATKKLTVTVDNDLNPLQTVNGNPIKYNGVELHKAASLPPALNQILRKNYYTKYCT